MYKRQVVKKVSGLNKRQRQELEDIPQKIDVLENEQAQLGEALSDASLYTTDPQKAQAHQDRVQEIDFELARLMQRWEELMGME